jgi:hypothetical protein
VARAETHASLDVLYEHRMTNARPHTQNAYPQPKLTSRGRRLIEADDATPNFDPTRIRTTSQPRKARC